MMLRSLSVKLVSKLERLDAGLFVALFVLIKFIPAYISSRLAVMVTGESITKDVEGFENVYQTFITLVVFAPLVETYVIQYLFFRYLSAHLPSALIVLLSALVFSLLHLYNFWYSIHAFFSGVILSFSYSCRKKPHPFITTSLIHAIYNLIVMIINP